MPRVIRVRTSADRAAGVVRVSVGDNGPGIPAHLRARVFEPFFTTKPTGVGTGVGLAVSLGIVEAHGGTFAVESPGDGGAVFTFTLPIGDVGTEAKAATAPGVEDAGCHRILIVDDEPEIRETLAEILDNACHSVVVAGSGREALQRMAADTFDVILTDIRMPGRALYQEICTRWPASAARVVFITGDTLATTLRDFVDASGRPVIEKPFLPADVRRIVDELAKGGAIRPSAPAGD